MARRRVFGRRRTLFQRINALPGGPVLLVLMCVALVGGLGFLAVKYAYPAVRALVKPTVSEMPLPLETEMPYTDYSDRIGEILFDQPEMRNIGMPVMYDNKIYFTIGRDAVTKDPELKQISYRALEHASLTDREEPIPALKPLVTREDGSEEQVFEILKNDNIVFIDIDDGNIVYFDGKSSGGGVICYYNAESNRVTELKQVYYGTPEVKLSGDCAVWLERTDKTTDKLYMMDVKTRELTTLAVFNNSPFGMSQPGVCSPRQGYGYVVWADYNEQYPDNLNFSTIKTRSIPYNEERSQDYEVDMYVHDPVTNGRAMAWTDGNEGESSSLFLSVDRAMPKRMAENVSYHGLGDGFLAWCEDGVIYAYFYDSGEKVRVTRPSELAMLTEVSDKGVVWFDITETRRLRDILKFAILVDDNG